MIDMAWSGCVMCKMLTKQLGNNLSFNNSF